MAKVQRAARSMLRFGWCWASAAGISALCAGQGPQPLPSRRDACVAPYWVLPDAGIGRTGSKAAVLPSSAMGENQRKCLVPCVQEDRHISIRKNLKKEGEMSAKIATEFFAEIEEKFGTHVHIIDWALHLDESTPHIHERHVFDCKNNYGKLCPQQEKALEELGVSLPNPDKKKGRNNSRKQTFDAECRKMLFRICENPNLFETGH